MQLATYQALIYLIRSCSCLLCRPRIRACILVIKSTFGTCGGGCMGASGGRAGAGGTIGGITLCLKRLCCICASSNAGVIAPPLFGRG